MEIEFSNVMKTCDSKGNLMPSYIFTSISSKMKEDGLVEDFVDQDTGFNWQRLTAKGKCFAQELDKKCK